MLPGQASTERALKTGIGSGVHADSLRAGVLENCRNAGHAKLRLQFILDIRTSRSLQAPPRWPGSRQQFRGLPHAGDSPPTSDGQALSLMPLSPPHRGFPVSGDSPMHGEKLPSPGTLGSRVQPYLIQEETGGPRKVQRAPRWPESRASLTTRLAGWLID